MNQSPFRGYTHRRNSYHNPKNSPYESKGHYYRHKNNSNKSFESPPTVFKRQSTDNGDFIPFDTSSPSFHDRRQSGQFFRPRGQRNNHSFGSQGSSSSPNNHISPNIYVDTSPSNFHRNSPRGRFSNNYRKTIDKIPVTEFINLKEILDDPWKDLMSDYNEKKNQSNLSANEESVKTSCSSDLTNMSLNDDDNILEYSSSSKFSTY